MAKIKIKITGGKVHDVGYRPFLIAMADEFELDGFGVRNVEVEGQQAVLVKAEGDEDSIQDFTAAIEKRRPVGADVSSVISESFDGRVPSIERTAITNMNFQLAKGISALTRMDGTLTKVDGTLTKVDGTLTKVDGTLTRMDKKMDKMLDLQDQTIEEAAGLRRDLKDDLGERLKRVEKDVRTIKSKVGLR
jgi:acylphosphatase